MFLRIILKWTTMEAHLYMQHHQGAKCEHFNVSDMIYHKSPHGASFHMLNGENVNIMWEHCLLEIFSSG